MSNDTSDPIAGSAMLPDVQDYLAWQHPFRKSRIYIHRRSLLEMQSHALELFRANEPAEIGGIAHGAKIAVGAEPSVVIKHFEIVSGTGPLYNSTPEHFSSLVTALDRSRIEGNMPVVGYFRSHVRTAPFLSRPDSVFLSKQDGELIEQYFRDPMSVFLVIRPLETSACKIGLFLWLNGRLEKDYSYLEVTLGDLEKPSIRKEPPFGASVAIDHPSNPIHTIAIGPPQAIGMPSQAEQESVVEGLRPRANARSRIRSFVALPVAIVAVVLLTIYFTPKLTSRRIGSMAEATAERPIGLQANRVPGGQVDLTWNSRIADTAIIQHARLAILDGPVYQRVEMDSRQFRLGKLVYFPKSSDLKVQMAVALGDSRSMSESIPVCISSGESGTVTMNRVDEPCH